VEKFRALAVLLGDQIMNSFFIPSLRTELQQLSSDQLDGIEIMGIPVEWMRYCEVCDSEQCFIANERCAVGLICHCTKCGDKRLVRFTRTGGISDAWEAYT
jgi:hypothetical protein